MKLLVQPGDGVTPLLEGIRNAKNRVEIAIFRFAQPGVRRRLGCTVLGPTEIAQIKRVLHSNLDAILDLRGSP